jgi:flagellar biosynthetic protein FliR
MTDSVPSFAGDHSSQIQYALTFVPTFAAVLVRVGAMFMFAPLFGSGRIPRRVKAAIALVLAFALTPTVAKVSFPASVFHLTAAVAGEMLFGLAMGMVMSLVFVAAQWAGEVLGQQLGFTLGAVFDPQYGGAGSVISDLLYMLTLVIFLALRGHHAMLMGLKDSFDALPLFSAGMGPGGLEIMTGLLLSCTSLTLKLSAPVLVTMLVSDVVLGFVSKTMPQLNVMSAGNSARALLGMLVIAAGLTFTSETMTDALLDSMSNLRKAWVTDWSTTSSATSPLAATAIAGGPHGR